MDSIVIGRNHLRETLCQLILKSCMFLILIAAVFSVVPDAITADLSDQNSKPAVSRDTHYRTQGVIGGPRSPVLTDADYPKPVGVPFGESRVIIWVVAQQLTYWGGFVFGALLIVTFLEFVALSVRMESTATRYDSYAREVLELIYLALPASITLGTLMLGTLILLYPGLFAYLAQLFRPILVVVSLVLVLFPLAVWLYGTTWTRMAESGHQWIHATLGLVANVFGVILLMLANAWSSFMLSPAGVDETGRFLGNYWHLLHTATWNTSNLHRIFGNIVFAAAVVMAYTAYRSIASHDSGRKAFYDRFSFTSLVVMFFSFIPLPFEGYWLSREIYAYRQQMGITMFGGLIAWIGIILVSVIASLFLALNYYLWQRIDATQSGHFYQTYSKYVFVFLALCVIVYVTPHIMVMTPLKLKQMGGQQHQLLGNYGVESAKQAAINIITLLTAWSLLIWSWSANPKARTMMEARLVTGAFLAAMINILWLGIYGYYIPANVRVGLNLPMWATTFMMVLLVSVLVIRNRRDIEDESVSWGGLANRAHYTAFFLAFAVTWVMGLGGYRRSSLRLFWHVNEIVRDASPWAYTHTVGFATNVVSLNALIFWGVLLTLLWLRHLMRNLTKAPTLSWSQK
jgi:cytochrome bd ubiquinol oxidase subunit I